MKMAFLRSKSENTHRIRENPVRRRSWNPLGKSREMILHNFLSEIQDKQVMAKRKKCDKKKIQIELRGIFELPILENDP